MRRAAEAAGLEECGVRPGGGADEDVAHKASGAMAASAALATDAVVAVPVETKLIRANCSDGTEGAIESACGSASDFAAR